MSVYNTVGKATHGAPVRTQSGKRIADLDSGGVQPRSIHGGTSVPFLPLNIPAPSCVINMSLFGKLEALASARPRSRTLYLKDLNM